MGVTNRTYSNSLSTTVRGLALLAFAVAIVAFVLSITPGLLAQGPACSPNIQEAEDGMTYGFTVGSDASASGGQFLHVPDGAGSSWDPSPAFRVELCFDVSTAGDYHIEGGVWSTDGTDDSFFVAVDGNMVGEGRWDIAHHTDYSGDYVNSYQMNDPTTFTLGVGEHTVEVYLREDGARLDTVKLVAVQPPPDPTCGGGWYEAEDGVVQGISVESKYIHVPDGSGSHWSPNESYSARYCITVGRDAVYRVNGRTFANSGTNDSFFVQVDGGAIWTWFVAQSNRYRNDLANDYQVEDPAEIYLTAGEHEIIVYAREDGTRLDRIRLERVRQRNCTRGRVEAEDGQVTGFSTGRDNSASGGEFVYAPDGSGSSWSASEDNKIEFCLTAPTDGAYELHAGVWADSYTNDSFFVKVDGVNYGRWDTLVNTNYDLDPVGVTTADPMILDLVAGNHTIEVLLREDGTRIDWVQLIPSGS